jgi:hypothetical protein
MPTSARTRRTSIRIATLVAPAAMLASAAVAGAEPDRATVIVPGVGVAPPHAGTWTLGIRYPWDVQSLPDGVVIGLGGLGLSFGAHLTPHLYLGACAESEAVTRASGNAASQYDRLRAGGEARLYFHDGTASSPPEGSPWGPVPRHDWLGARYGVETFDQGTHVGRFADATVGTDIVLGAVGVSLYVSAGVSWEQPAAFGDPAPVVNAFVRSASLGAPSGDRTTSPYIAFGMGVVFE